MTDETDRLRAEVTAFNEEDSEALASKLLEVSSTDPDGNASQWSLESDEIREIFLDRARALLESGVVVSSGQVRRFAQAVSDHQDYPLDDEDVAVNTTLATVSRRVLELLPEQT